MQTSWIHRVSLALACAGAMSLLAACGSGSVVSDLEPKRFLTVGDSFADVGQGGTRYTVNDGSFNWVQQLAAEYQLGVAPAAAGGFGYAQGRARVSDTGAGGEPSVTAQIDALLARTSMEDGDVLMINGGMHDIVAAVSATGISDESTQAVKAAGKALADQVRRVVDAGAKHVVVTGVPNLGLTPWALGLDSKGAIEDLSVAFNDSLLIGIADLGDHVLYFDAALFFNLMNNKPENYGLDNVDTPVCTTADASTCTTATVRVENYNRYLYADGLHFTPEAQRRFVSTSYAENALSRFRNRW